MLLQVQLDTEVCEKKVRHGEDAGARVGEGEVLVGKGPAVDGATARAVVVREVAALALRGGRGVSWR